VTSNILFTSKFDLRFSEIYMRKEHRVF